MLKFNNESQYEGLSREEILSMRAAKTIELLNGKAEQKREQIRSYFHKTFTLYEALFATVKEDAFFYKADPLRHPLIFYWGHTACFYINKLVLAKLLDTHIDTHIESICAVGVDEMSWDDLNEESYDWPSVSYVADYRNKVRDVVDKLIVSLPLTMPLDWSSPMYVMLMAIEHEKIHIETSSVLIRQLKLSDVIPSPLLEPCREYGEAPVNSLVPIAKDRVELGKSYVSNTYGWDNEYGKHIAEVDEFKVSKYLVSNGEFLAFVEAGGYETQRYWSVEGWSWCTYEKAKYPRFWSQDEDGHYMQRNMTENILMPWNWPVECNYLEANAFCTWKSETDKKNIRMPTEDEYMVLHSHMDEQRNQPHWDAHSSEDINKRTGVEGGGAPGNIDLQYFASSCPVDMFQQSEKLGLYDVVGNVWQWTETPIYPFEGFKVHPMYDDFTVPTYDTKHNLIKGGSWVSGGNLATVQSRYAFRRHFYQHAGFRYIQSENAPVIPANAEPYEVAEEVCVPVHAQFGRIVSKFVPQVNFSCKAASLCGEHLMPRLHKGKESSVLEVGCLGGRMSFELAKHFESVVGIESTARLIQVGHRLQDGKVFRYVTKREGEIYDFRELSAQKCGITQDMISKVQLIQSNPNNMYARLKGYDLVIVSDICRIAYPVQFLSSIHTRMCESSLLVVFSSNDWNTSTSSVTDWVGGHKVDGENVFTDAGTEAALRTNFSKVEMDSELHTIPLVLEESRTKVTVLEMEFSVWRRL
eukprot:CFRG4534T1